MNNEHIDTLVGRLKTLLDRAEEQNKQGNFDEAEMLANKVLAELENAGSSLENGTLNEAETLRVSALLVLGWVFYMRGDFPFALEHFSDSLAKSEAARDKTGTAKAMNGLGVVHVALSDYPRALECYLNGLALHEEVGNKALAANISSNIGLLYNYLSDHALALEYYVKGLAIHKELGNKASAANVTGNIGNVYYALSDYPRALEYYTTALAMHEEVGNNASAAIVTSGLGNVHASLSAFPRALEYFDKALSAFEELGQKAESARIVRSIGSVYISLSDFGRALEYFAKALAVHEELGQKAEAALVTGDIGRVYYYLTDYPRALEYLNKALAVHKKLGQKSQAASITGNIGNVYQLLGDYPRALEYSAKSLAAFEELGDRSAAAADTGNIGNIYKRLGEYPRALEYYTKAFIAHEELGNKGAVAFVTSNIGALYADTKFEGYDAAKAEAYLLKAVAMCEEVGARLDLFGAEKALAELYENEKRWEEFAIHYKKYIALKDEVVSEEARKTAMQMEQQRQIAEREKEIAIASARHEATEKLLHNVLPPSIADKMLGGTKLIAEKLSNVSVLFADIVNFTKLSQSITPEELVEGLDRIFSEFDALAEKYGLEKIKTIGDAYMVVSGAPEPRADHAQAMAFMAIEMMDAMKEFRSISTGERIKLRIGIHSGDVVAGVIGKKKFAYDLWGDAVNTASRMESHGESGRIHVSEDFAFHLQNRMDMMNDDLGGITFEERDEIEIKGKGKMKTYFLEAKP